MAKNYVYGILGEPASYDTSRYNYENGWIFTPKSNIYFYGFRVKAPNAVQKTCTLWDVSTKTVLAQAQLTTVAGQWVEVLLKNAPQLTANTQYCMSTWTNESYYYTSSYNITFNTDFISYVTGKVGNSQGAYPDKYTENSQIYPMIDALLALTPPSIIKHLIEDTDSHIYTIVDDALSDITASVSSPLTAQDFQDYGVDDVPTGSLLITLDSPSVYCWTNNSTAVTLTADVEAVPVPQVVYSQNIDMTAQEITGIDSVDIVSDAETLFAVSFDDGLTWWNYVNNAWVQLSTGASGQIASDIEEIGTTAWAQKTITGHIKFRWTLNDTDSYVTSITVNFLN